MPIIPTAHYSNCPLSQLPIIQTAHYHNCPLSQLPIIPTSHYPNCPLSHLPIIPTARYPNFAISQLPTIPTAHYPNCPKSQLSIIPTAHYPNFPLLQLPTIPTVYYPNCPSSQLSTIPTAHSPYCPIAHYPNCPLSHQHPFPTAHYSYCLIALVAIISTKYCPLSLLPYSQLGPAWARIKPAMAEADDWFVRIPPHYRLGVSDPHCQAMGTGPRLALLGLLLGWQPASGIDGCPKMDKSKCDGLACEVSWRCGDTCLGLSSMCWCGEDVFTIWDGKWCCNTGPCTVRWGEVLTCPGNALYLNQTCRGLCNYFLKDKERNSLLTDRSRVPCSDGRECVPENMKASLLDQYQWVCQGEARCRDKSDLAWCREPGTTVEECPLTPETEGFSDQDIRCNITGGLSG